MTFRLPLHSFPAGRAMLALPLLALLASTASANEAPGAGAEMHLDAVAESDLTPRAQRAFEHARGALEAGLARTAANLESQLVSDDVKAAETLYALERRAVSLLVYIETHDVESTGMTHEQTVGGVRSMLQRILRYQERVKEHAQEKLDRVLPGEPERKLLLVRGRDRYKPLFRQGTPKPGEAPISEEQRLAEMAKDFAAKGGDLKRDIKLLGLRYLQELPSGELAEWTQLSPTHISITNKGAKHPLILSEGLKRLGRRREAGQVSGLGGGSYKQWRDSEGEVVVGIATNSSGNLKPGVASVEGFVLKLIQLGIPEERILTTSIVPGEPELVKLLLKARLTMSKQEIDEHIAKLVIDSKPEELGEVGRSHRTFAPSMLKFRAARPTTIRYARDKLRNQVDAFKRLVAKRLVAKR